MTKELFIDKNSICSLNYTLNTHHYMCRRRHFQFGVKFLRAENPASGGTPTVLAQCHWVLRRQPDVIRLP